jgi:TPR repeat protein
VRVSGRSAHDLRRLCHWMGCIVVNDWTNSVPAFRTVLSVCLVLGTFAGIVACGPSNNTSTPRDGARQSATKQLQRLRQDADQGSRLGQYVLGVMYQLGEIVPQDHVEAAKWVRRAADQDLAVAQFVLGAMYVLGRGVPEDHIRAHMWLNLSEARALQIEGGQKLARDAHQLRATLELKMSPAQIEEAVQEAQGWKPKPER